MGSRQIVCVRGGEGQVEATADSFWGRGAILVKLAGLPRCYPGGRPLPGPSPPQPRSLTPPGPGRPPTRALPLRPPLPARPAYLSPARAALQSVSPPRRRPVSRPLPRHSTHSPRPSGLSTRRPSSGRRLRSLPDVNHKAGVLASHTTHTQTDLYTRLFLLLTSLAPTLTSVQ